MTLDKLLENPDLTNKQRSNIIELFEEYAYKFYPSDIHSNSQYFVRPYIVRGHIRLRHRQLKLVEKKHA